MSHDPTHSPTRESAGPTTSHPLRRPDDTLGQRRDATGYVERGEGSVPAAMFVVVQGEETGRRIDLGARPLEIGRAVDDARGRLTDESLAERHACIEFERGVWVVRNLTGHRGVYVNEHRVDDEYALRDGDRIRLGHVVLKLLQGGDLHGRYTEEMFRIATLDGLTFAASRRLFEETLARDLERSRRLSRPLALVVFDVDGFRSLIASLGEQAGNVLLQRISQRTRGLLRRHDLLARIGTDMFAVALTESDLNDAHRAGERLREQVEAERVIAEGEQVSRTISVGIAQAKPEEDATSLLERGRRAMLVSRHAGGNRVSTAADEPASVAAPPPAG